MPALAATVPKFLLVKVNTFTKAGGSGVLITYLGDSPANPVTGKVIPLAFERYSFWHNGTKVILTLSGSTNADNVDPWKIVTNSFSWR